MLFRPNLVDLILAQKKTQTRRTLRTSAHTWYEVDYEGYRATPKLDLGYPILAVRLVSDDDSERSVWRVGQTLAVQPGRGKPGVARIRVTAIRYCERARQISDDNARAEGFATPSQFCDVYMRLNGAAALDQPCWAIEFVLMAAGAPGGEED